MNLDELKAAWQQQEQSIRHTQKTNEQLLRAILQQRSTDAVGQMLNVEYLSAAVAALVLLIIICCASLLTTSGAMLAAFISSVLMVTCILGWSAFKIRFLQRLDFSNEPVTVVAEQLEQFRLMIVKERAISLIGAPLLMIALIPLAHRLIHGDSAFNYMSTYAVRIVAGYVVIVVFSIVFYRKYYFRNIQSATRHLEEIKSFRD